MRSSKGHGVSGKRLRSDLITVYSLLTRGSKEVGAEIFSIGSTDRTYGEPEEVQAGR